MPKQARRTGRSPAPVKKAKVAAAKAVPKPPAPAKKAPTKAAIASKQPPAAKTVPKTAPKAAAKPAKPAKPTPPAKSTTPAKAVAKATPTPPPPAPSDAKMVTQLKKGRAAVDLECPQAKSSHVYDDAAKVWTATLNQTSLTKNANKYYIIQLLQDDNNAGKYWVWNRWGRVGYAGQNALKGPFTDLNRAKNEYESKLRDKTKGGYVELDIVYDEPDAEVKPAAPAPKAKGKAKPPAPALDSRIQGLIRLIFDLNMINKALAEIGYDAKKMPLGKLSAANLKRGFEVLKRIEDALDHKNTSALGTLSSEFFTLIPHDFGFQHMSQFVINTKQKLKEKVEMLESLGEMKIATNMIAEDTSSLDPLVSNYSKLHCELQPIERDTDIFRLLEDYVQTTHAATHSYYTLTVLDIFEVERESEDARFNKKLHNRMLLWHGSRLTNWVGILSQGLRIAPPEAPVSGYMFGKGVYFADMVSKSANYCCSSREQNVGCMMLCEVALGNPNELLHADFNASTLPANKHSTKGCGSTQPDPKTYRDLNGVTVPIGKGVPSNRNGGLFYNEFIVYDVSQIKMRYLFKMRFNYR